MVNVCKDVEKLEPSSIAGGNIVQPLGNGLTVPKKMLYKELIHDPAVSQVGIYAREMKIYFHTETCTQMHTVALFIIAKG